MKVTQIPDPIYHARIYLILNATEKTLKTFFKTKYNYEYTHNRFYSSFHFVLLNETKGFRDHFLVIEGFKNTVADVGTVNHELYHLVNSVLTYRGLTYSSDSEEAYAYYLDYLTEQTLKKLC